jgi:hypothetical protein
MHRPRPALPAGAAHRARPAAGPAARRARVPAGLEVGHRCLPAAAWSAATGRHRRPAGRRGGTDRGRHDGPRPRGRAGHGPAPHCRARPGRSGAITRTAAAPAGRDGRGHATAPLVTCVAALIDPAAKSCTAARAPATRRRCLCCPAARPASSTCPQNCRSAWTLGRSRPPASAYRRSRRPPVRGTSIGHRRPGASLSSCSAPVNGIRCPGGPRPVTVITFGGGQRSSHIPRSHTFRSAGIRHHGGTAPGP